MRIIIGDSANRPGSGRARTDHVVCRFGHKETLQLTLVKEGGAVTVRIQGDQVEPKPADRNGRNGSKRTISRKPRVP